MGKKKLKKSWTGKEVVRAKRLPRKDEQYAVVREALGALASMCFVVMG